VESLHRTGILYCLIGPAGSGKTSLCERLLAEFGDAVRYSTSVTTRAPRPGEIPGKSYHFVTREEFEDARARGEFFEWEEVHGNLYGTRLSTLTDCIKSGIDLLLAIDIRGALKVRESFPFNAVLTFLVPPSVEELIARVTARNQISQPAGSGHRLSGGEPRFRANL
jgi:guanylate kinase